MKKSRHKKTSQPSVAKNKRSNTLLYGQHAVLAALKNPGRTCKVLYTTQKAAKGLPNLKLPAGCDHKTVDNDFFKNAFDEGTVHQHIALDCTPIPQMHLEDFLDQTKDQPHTFIAILDQVTDPHNVGAILRSAAAFNIQALIVQDKNAPGLTPALAKIACGAVEHVPVIEVTNISRTLETLKSKHFFCVGLDERGSQYLGDIVPHQKLAMVLGAEGPGIRRLVKESCDKLVKLPNSEQMPSINVSNAAAICFYEISNSADK